MLIAKKITEEVDYNAVNSPNDSKTRTNYVNRTNSRSVMRDKQKNAQAKSQLGITNNHANYLENSIMGCHVRRCR